VNREKLLEESKWKLEHGEAPTEETIKEFQREERKKQQQLETTMRREEELQRTQTLSGNGNVMKSTAEPRPTAYIPDDLGIPKPYGQSAPFKPSELGSSMRHIRVPNPKPIEL
jgi:hypothetical protein